MRHVGSININVLAFGRYTHGNQTNSKFLAFYGQFIYSFILLYLDVNIYYINI